MSVLDRISIPRRHQILGLLLVALGLLVGLSLLSFTGLAGGRPLRVLPGDCCGLLGRALARGLVGLCGRYAALLVPIGLIAWGQNRLFLRPPGALAARSLAALALTLFLLGLLGLGDGSGGRAGHLGQAIAVAATGILGEVGAHLVLWTGLLVSVLALLDLGLADLLVTLAGAWHEAVERGQRAPRSAARPEPGRRRPLPGGGARSAGGDSRAAGRRRRSPKRRCAQRRRRGPRPLRVPVAPVGDFKSRLRAERERLQAAMASDLSPPRVARPEELAGHPGVDAQAPVLAPDAHPGNGSGDRQAKAHPAARAARPSPPRELAFVSADDGEGTADNGTEELAGQRRDGGPGSTRRAPRSLPAPLPPPSPRRSRARAAPRTRSRTWRSSRRRRPPPRIDRRNPRS